MYNIHTDSHESAPLDYQYMMILQRRYKAPAFLMYDHTLPYDRRVHLLHHWCEGRARYLYENFRDWDYLSDRQLDQLQRCIHKMKTTEEVA